MRYAVVLVLVLGCSSGFAQDVPEVRTWTAGDFTEKGTFVSLVGESVTLRLVNGDEVEVGLSDLSESDREYVRTKAVKPSPFRRRQSLKNSIGIELKLIPAGTFTMGDAGGDGDETPHKVTLTKPYYLGVYEVTNAQWKAVMGSVPSWWKDDDRPVEQVSWEDAVDFCRRLSALPEERKAGRVYRLPTEAEWEYACRAGTDTNYSFGDDESRLDEYGWYDGNSGDQTHPVGQKKPNAWGLYDMHGNVWEWCSDWYGEYPKRAVTDPQRASRASARVLRGGSWFSSAGGCRSADRNGGDPSSRHDLAFLGFRLALIPSGASPPEAGK